MPIEILMPALSPTMEEGKLAKWNVREGDIIKAGDIIAEIETDKATMEVEAVDEGRIGKLLVAAGTEGVKVNTVIAVLLADGETMEAVTTTPKAAPSTTPPATAVAAPATPATTAPAVTSTAGRIAASPLARRIAKELGIDLTQLNGSGPNGRIVRADVEAAKSAGPVAKPVSKPTAATAPAPAPIAAMADDKIRAMFEAGSFSEVPHDGMRKTIARRLLESKTTVPHFYLSVDCRLDALLALREQANARAPQKDGKPSYKLSVNDFIIKAMAMALQQVPDANVTWTESAMLKHRHSDVGVAVAIPGGLITPVIRKAETKGLVAISTEMKDLAKRARERKLAPSEFQGGTTAVSNLGMFGIKNFSAVINPPHATILAVGAGEERAIVRNGQIEVANMMSVTLSVDHRAVDGALGAELLAAFRALIEDPLALLL